MLADGAGFGGQYETYRENLTDDTLLRVAHRISTSKRFEWGGFCHIVLQDTETIIGYVGNNSVELCCPEGKDPALYRIPHKHLKRIFRAATNRVFHKLEGLLEDSDSLTTPVQPVLLSS